MSKVQEVIEAPLSSEELAARYRGLCEDLRFANLPGKVELDVWGRIVMSPASYYHGLIQGRLCRRLAVLGGEASVEAPVVTPTGVLVADVAWASAEFVRVHGLEHPLKQAPELCIEVASPSNSSKELQEKTQAYLAAGAEEVWIVYQQSKRYEFHNKHGLMQRSTYAIDLAGLFA